MPQQPKGPLALSLLIITVGVGWLLTSQGYGPGINWVWTLGLGVIGILTFILSGGIDKASVVVGPFFLVGSLLSIFRQSGHLNVDAEIPILVILIGVLLFVAQMQFVPAPCWLEPLSADAKKRPPE